MKKTIAVLFGGRSSEHDVSLKSACSVIQHLAAEKYRAIMLGITLGGEWMRYEGPAERIGAGTWQSHESCVPAVISPDRRTHGILAFTQGGVSAQRVDAALPVLHGKNGEDGTVQGLLELAGIPCVGCGTLSSAVCMDKDIAHRLARSAGVCTPPSVTAYAGMPCDKLRGLAGSLKYPLFVKPANAGSSFGVSKVTRESELLPAVSQAFLFDRKVVIEQAIDGFEVGCAILGNETLTVGQVDEIELNSNFFDYQEKYCGNTTRIHLPARIDMDTSERIKRTAETVYRALCCSGFARIDMFLTPQKDIVFNEVNTIPGFTAHSRFPGMLRGAGISFEQILDTAISLALGDQ